MDANHKLFKKKYLKILSCYDATSASIANLVGCDAVLIGDSIGVLVLGHANTSEIGINTLLEFLKIIKKTKGSSLSFVCDVTNLNEFEKVLKKISRLDILVNNAGNNRPEHFTKVTQENMNYLCLYF